jgi:hypothetical protein
MTRICALWLGLVFVIPCVAQARQAQDFARLKLEVGDVVFVTDRVSGEEFSGVLTSLTPASLVVAGRGVTPRPGLTIERRGDPVWEGAVIAGVVGAIVGVQVGHEACLDRSKWWCAAEGAAIYAAMGALYDAMHTGRTTVYRSSTRPTVVFGAGQTIAPNALAPGGTMSGALEGGGSIPAYYSVLGRVASPRAADGSGRHWLVGLTWFDLTTVHPTLNRPAVRERASNLTVGRGWDRVFANGMRVSGELALTGGDGFGIAATLVVQRQPWR